MAKSELLKCELSFLDRFLDFFKKIKPRPSNQANKSLQKRQEVK